MRIVTVTGSAADSPSAVVIDDEPAFSPMTAWAGEPLDKVRLHEIDTRGDIELQLIEIQAGGGFVMHSSDKLAFCHVVRGSGLLGLADGTSVAFHGPETFVFHPGALHGWHDITSDTLMSVAIVPDNARV